MDNSINTKERAHRQALAGKARELIAKTMNVEDSDDSTLAMSFDCFYLHIAFSELHPLIVFYLARPLNRQGTQKDIQVVNELNLRSVLGSHAVNTEAGCYSYRTVHWLDTELTENRFMEILARGAGEAKRAYANIA